MQKDAKKRKEVRRRTSVGKVNTKTGSKRSSSGRVKNGNKPDKTSATVRSYERKKKIENTQILGNLTSELPILGGGRLDGPDRRPWKDIRLPKPDINFSVHKTIRLTALAVLLLIIACAIVLKLYTVENVIIEGSTHYSNEEIYNMVIGDNPIAKSSIYLRFKYRNKDVEDIPFIQALNVRIESRDTIRIVVYEKALAGFVEYMGTYFYFDKDGTVVEASNVKTKGIPQVLGLKFDHVVIYEDLPVGDDKIFREILEISQLLDKYGIAADKLYFDSDMKATLYFGDARVKLGDSKDIDEKIIRLKAILPEMEGKKGVLRLENFDGSSDIITFELDREDQ